MPGCVCVRFRSIRDQNHTLSDPGTGFDRSGPKIRFHFFFGYRVDVGVGRCVGWPTGARSPLHPRRFGFPLSLGFTFPYNPPCCDYLALRPLYRWCLLAPRRLPPSAFWLHCSALNSGRPKHLSLEKRDSGQSFHHILSSQPRSIEVGCAWSASAPQCVRPTNLHRGHGEGNQPPFWTPGRQPTSILDTRGSTNLLRGQPSRRQAADLYFFRGRGSAWGSRTTGWNMGGGGYPRKWRIRSLDSWCAPGPP